MVTKLSEILSYYQAAQMIRLCGIKELAALISYYFGI